MNDLPQVPEMMSLEGRANMILDETGRADHAGKPTERREHIRKHLLAHFRAALEQQAKLAERTG